MRRFTWCIALCLGMTSVPLAWAHGPKVKGSQAKTCGDYGTTVDFAASPVDAAVKALKEQKLVFVLHISGEFEDSDRT